MAHSLRQMDNSMRTLEIELTQMAAQVEAQLSRAITAFERRDVAFAESIVLADAKIDHLHIQIERRVMKILGAGGLEEAALREVMAAMKIAGELERVGDLAKNVGKRTLVISREQPSKAASGVTRMGRASLRQISDILTAYSSRNITAARAVWRGDDDLDELYNSVFREILLEMMEDSGAVNACTHLVFIAKNYERVGDHATNIAEALHFLVTGDLMSGARPKGDDTASAFVTPPVEENL